MWKTIKFLCQWSTFQSSQLYEFLCAWYFSWVNVQSIVYTGPDILLLTLSKVKFTRYTWYLTQLCDILSVTSLTPHLGTLIVNNSPLIVVSILLFVILTHLQMIPSPIMTPLNDLQTIPVPPNFRQFQPQFWLRYWSVHSSVIDDSISLLPCVGYFLKLDYIHPQQFSTYYLVLTSGWIKGPTTVTMTDRESEFIDISQVQMACGVEPVSYRLIV